MPKTSLLLLLLICAAAHASTENTTEDSSSPDPLAGKHESLDHCPMIGFEPTEYKILANGSARIIVHNRTYDEEYYFKNDQDYLFVCDPFSDPPKEVDEGISPLGMLTLVGIAVSGVCLLLHLLSFVFIQQRRNLPSWNLATLCLALFLSYLLMFVSSMKESFEKTTFCAVVGSLLQFFFLSSFLWMFVISLNIFRSILRATGSLRAPTNRFHAHKYLLQSLVAWGGALMLCAAALVSGGPALFLKTCWFSSQKTLLIFFAGPVFAVICVNFVLFSCSAYTIFSNRMRMDPEDSARTELRRNHAMYFRLAAIMGVTWVTTVSAPWVHAPWLLMLSAALNCFQGLFIFLGFTCNAKTRKLFLAKFRGAGDKRISNTPPTFKSYYCNSIEKDLEPVVDSKEKNTLGNGATIHI